MASSAAPSIGHASARRDGQIAILQTLVAITCTWYSGRGGLTLYIAGEVPNAVSYDLHPHPRLFVPLNVFQLFLRPEILVSALIEVLNN